MKKQSVEMEKVTIELPKRILDFLRFVEKSPEEYLEESLVQVVKADFDAGIWSPEEVFPTAPAAA